LLSLLLNTINRKNNACIKPDATCLCWHHLSQQLAWNHQTCNIINADAARDRSHEDNLWQ